MPASAISVTRTGERSQNPPTPTPPLAFLSFPLSQWRGKVFGFPKQTPRTHVVLAQPSLPVGGRWNDGGVDGERGNSCAGREPDRSCLNWGKEPSVWAGAQMRTGLCCGERTVFMFFLTLFLARSFGPERRHSVSPGLRTHGTLLLSGKTKKARDNPGCYASNNRDANISPLQLTTHSPAIRRASLRMGDTENSGVFGKVK